MRRFVWLVLIAGLAVAAFLALNFVRGWTGDGPAAKDMTVIISPGTTLDTETRYSRA